MRKFKSLIGISLMLCVVLVSCDVDDLPPLPPGEWSAGDLRFFPISLTPDTRRYRISDRNGNWNREFTVLQNFWDVFDVPAMDGASHQSQINVTTRYSTRLFNSREYNSRNSPAVGLHELRVYAFYDNDRRAFGDQTVNIDIFSGLYRQVESGHNGRLFWNWNGRARDFNVDNITYHPGQIPLILGGEWQEEGTWRRITPAGGSGGGEVHAIDDSRFELVEHNNDRCPWTAVRDVSNLVIIEAEQIGIKEGVLRVYATEATFNAMMFR